MAFLDWLDCYQDYPEPLPLIGDKGYQVVDLVTGDVSATKGMRHVHEGSYSTKLTIKVSGNRLSFSGNPSVYGRLDNLFGFSSLDECFSVFNRVCLSLDLPAFTKCTKLWHLDGEDGSKAATHTDGAVITRLDVTTNKAVGQSNESQYLRALSMLPFGNAVPHLYANGNTVDWKNKQGKSMQDYYFKVYSKANQIRDLSLFKAVKKYGKTSSEVSYLQSVIDFCSTYGVCRFEQELKWLPQKKPSQLLGLIFT